ncbi:MAG: hypothetical protein ABI666_02155 [Ferruginibacter sp.]
MKHLILAIVAFCSPVIVFCQDITGFWTGTLYNDATQQSLPYEVYISKTNGKYSGFSQTWFLINEKKYYGIKKINVRIAKDGKIVIQDASMVENNYPAEQNKNIIQLNVLDLVNNNNETVLDGLFVTNRTRSIGELTGHINLKRVSASNESGLMQYLQKNNSGAEITAAK